MKNGGGHFAPKLGGQFELESGGHFKLELGGQYHWNLQFKSSLIYYTIKKLFVFSVFILLLNLWGNIFILEHPRKNAII